MMGVSEAVIDTLNTGRGLLEDEPQPPVVLQVLPSLEPDRAGRAAAEIAGAIVAAGGVAIIASAGGRMVRLLDRVGARHVSLPLDSRNPFVIAANAGRLTRLVRRNGIDILHAYGHAPAWSARVAARRTGRPFITTVHALPKGDGYLRRRYNAAMAAGDRVIAVSDFVAEHVVANCAVEPDRLRLVHGGIDLRHFDPDQVSPHRIAQLSQQWRLPDGVPLVLVPGRFVRPRGHRAVIEALTHLGDRELLCVLVAAEGDAEGPAAYRREIEGLIDRYGLGDRVYIAGVCADMPAAYMLADVVVSCPTRPDSFAGVIAEARAMGRPVVAGDHGAAREQLAEGLMSWLVAPDDPAAIAAAIGEALDLTGEERSRFAPAVIAAARARFSKDVMCARTLAVYAELLGAAAGGAR
jgi:glycosyltransferase involved in cell wall biosynthesis